MKSLSTKTLLSLPKRSIITRLSQMFTKRSEYHKEQAKFGKDRDDSYRLEYEKDMKQRVESKMNWNIKNRWEQRQLDDVLRNQDIKAMKFRDFTMIEQGKLDIQEFHNVDEIYYYMETMFADGFTEKHINIALDIFLRDAAQFNDKDLQSSTFLQFVRELGKSLMIFKEEKTYLKTAKFMDIYCLDDKYLWINMEQFIIRKESLFSPRT